MDCKTKSNKKATEKKASPFLALVPTLFFTLPFPFPQRE
jgi:hypothetical protein